MVASERRGVLAGLPFRGRARAWTSVTSAAVKATAAELGILHDVYFFAPPYTFTAVAAEFTYALEWNPAFPQKLLKILRTVFVIGAVFSPYRFPEVGLGPVGCTQLVHFD